MTVTDPHFVPERGGVMTPDGERGLVWTVNVLAVYIMVSHPYSQSLDSDAAIPAQRTGTPPSSIPRFPPCRASCYSLQLLHCIPLASPTRPLGRLPALAL